MKKFGLAMVASTVTGLYWWIVFATVYADALFFGESAPSRQPVPDQDVLLRSGTTILIGVLVYAGACILWQRVAARMRRVR